VTRRHPAIWTIRIDARPPPHKNRCPRVETGGASEEDQKARRGGRAEYNNLTIQVRSEYRGLGIASASAAAITDGRADNRWGADLGSA